MTRHDDTILEKKGRLSRPKRGRKINSQLHDDIERKEGTVDIL